MNNPLARIKPHAATIEGVLRFPMPSAADHRGVLGVVGRADWPSPPLVQWNLARSEPDTVRGFHVHVHHTDWLCAVSGTMYVGLRDLRTWSVTFGMTETICLEPFGDVVVIPPGVGHVFVSVEATTHLYATDTYWDVADEFGCRWDDPALQIDWTFLPALQSATVLLSDRDAGAGGLADLVSVVTQFEPELTSQPSHVGSIP